MSEHSDSEDMSDDEWIMKREKYWADHNVTPLVVPREVANNPRELHKVLMDHFHPIQPSPPPPAPLAQSSPTPAPPPTPPPAQSPPSDDDRPSLTPTPPSDDESWNPANYVKLPKGIQFGNNPEFFKFLDDLPRN